MSQIKIKRSVWDKLTRAQREKVCFTPEHLTLGLPVVLGADCVFDHLRITPVDQKAVQDLVRSFNRPKKKATTQGK